MSKKNSKEFKDSDLKGVSGGDGVFSKIKKGVNKIFHRKSSEDLLDDVNKMDGSLVTPDDKD